MTFCEQEIADFCIENKNIDKNKKRMQVALAFFSYFE